MKLPGFITLPLGRMANRVMSGRQPDFIIGNGKTPYMLRWWLLPRNPIFNVYLHDIRRSDDDRALHDHPWLNISVILVGGYVEHTIDAGGVHRRTERKTGDVVVRRPKAAHRLEMERNGVCWSLFIIGPRIRDWGFHCPDAGWIPWKKFVAPGDKGQVGKGCDQ